MIVDNLYLEISVKGIESFLQTHGKQGVFHGIYSKVSFLIFDTKDVG